MSDEKSEFRINVAGEEVEFKTCDELPDDLPEIPWRKFEKSVINAECEGEFVREVTDADKALYEWFKEGFAEPEEPYEPEGIAFVHQDDYIVELLGAKFQLGPGGNVEVSWEDYRVWLFNERSGGCISDDEVLFYYNTRFVDEASIGWPGLKL